jgi:hypothetical protein
MVCFAGIKQEKSACERIIKHPAITAITKAAREEFFDYRNAGLGMS